MMHLPNSDQHSSGGSVEASMAKLLKRQYSKPVLQVYGAVSVLTLGAAGSVGDSGNQSMAMSDQNVKMNIVRVGDHPLGVGLYLFDYKPEYCESGGRGRQFGVMAQEVETVMPEAVSIHPDGYKMVNYALLGISHRIQ